MLNIVQKFNNDSNKNSVEKLQFFVCATQHFERKKNLKEAFFKENLFKETLFKDALFKETLVKETFF